MTIPEFKRDLSNYKDSFTRLLYFNIESPKRVQSLINETVSFLQPIKCEKKLRLKIEESIIDLQSAYSHSEDFSKGLRTDFSRTNDLAAIHIDENDNSWAQQVIGTAEAAIDNILRFLGND